MDSTDDLATCSDEELLACFREGQSEAFGALVRRYEAELYGYLRRYLGDANLADDVFQNTFVQIFSKISQYETGRAVRPWLYTIATHQAIDALRRNGRHIALSIDQERENSQGAETSQLLSMLQSRGESPLDAVQADERRDLVRESVERLPEMLKQVIILAYFQGLKYRDIADIVGIPVGTVKSRMHSALMKLQEAWGESEVLRE